MSERRFPPPWKLDDTTACFNSDHRKQEPSRLRCDCSVVVAVASFPFQPQTAAVRPCTQANCAGLWFHRWRHLTSKAMPDLRFIERRNKAVVVERVGPFEQGEDSFRREYGWQVRIAELHNAGPSASRLSWQVVYVLDGNGREIRNAVDI
jgi:hypothetical protein